MPENGESISLDQEASNGQVIAPGIYRDAAWFVAEAYESSPSEGASRVGSFFRNNNAAPGLNVT